MAIGYATPQAGQADLDGRYTVWLRMPDGKWYSPKDISGLPRRLATPRHVKALEGKYLQGTSKNSSRQVGTNLTR
jgi:hypothetical protein